MRSSVCIAYLLVPGPVAGHTKGRLAEAAGEGPGPGVGQRVAQHVALVGPRLTTDRAPPVHRTTPCHRLHYLGNAEHQSTSFFVG